MFRFLKRPFFLFRTLFLWSRTACTSRPSRPILTIYTLYDVYPLKEVPFGGRVYITPYFGGQISPKPPFLGATICVSSQTQNIITFVIPNFAQWQRPPNTVYRSSQNALHKYNMADGRNLEKNKSLYLSNRLNDFDNLHVIWRVSVQGSAFVFWVNIAAYFMGQRLPKRPF